MSRIKTAVSLRRDENGTYTGVHDGYSVVIWRSTQTFTGTSRGRWVEKTEPCWRGTISDGRTSLLLDPTPTAREAIDDAVRTIKLRKARDAVDTSWIDLATS